VAPTKITVVPDDCERAPLARIWVGCKHQGSRKTPMTTQPPATRSSHRIDGETTSAGCRKRTDGATRAAPATRTCGNTNAGLDQPRPTVALVARSASDPSARNWDECATRRCSEQPSRTVAGSPKQWLAGRPVARRKRSLEPPAFPWQRGRNFRRQRDHAQGPLASSGRSNRRGLGNPAETRAAQPGGTAWNSIR
jgi:hypothetical protein